MWPGFPAPTAPPSPPKPKTIYSPIVMTPIITITSNPIPQNIQLVLDEFGIKEPEPEKCTCDIMKLMSVGCKCGQFQREQSRK